MSALVAILLPLALALLLTGPPRLRTWVYRAAPLASLVLIWPLMDQPEISFHWLLLGVSLKVDDASTSLLLLTATAWTLAGWQSLSLIDRDQRWFWGGWLGALSGMSLLLLAADMASFYIGYAVLSLSAYLLVTQARSDAAWRAGRVYLVMALMGEASILAGICLIAGHLGNISFDQLAASAEVLFESPARWLLLFGFAVKLGIIPLHFWLPLAHPVAPAPASAILSGVIVKAGLLGCLRLVPPLALDPEWIGHLLLGIGLMTAFGGVLLGLGQERLKTVLAYSTISQMGLILTVVALQFLIPEQREWLLLVIGLMALHHGLNKAALFLGCAQAPGSSRWRLLLFGLPALSLAAAPLTTGAIAKLALKTAYAEAALGNALLMLLSLTSAATAALMWKAFRMARASQSEQAMHPAWPLLVLAALSLPWLAAAYSELNVATDLGKLIDSAWPLLLAALMIALLGGTVLAQRWRLPEGDGIVMIEAALRRIPSIEEHSISASNQADTWHRHMGPVLRAAERQQQRLPAAGLAVLATGGLLWALIQWLGVG